MLHQRVARATQRVVAVGRLSKWLVAGISLAPPRPRCTDGECERSTDGGSWNGG
jgi:hypothetical protein